ncbi:MAG: hypothetical protein R6U92_04400 [Bacillota bacterium]
MAVRVSDSSLARTPEIHTWWDSDSSGEALLAQIAVRAERPFLISIPESLPRVSAIPGKKIPEIGEMLMFGEMEERPIPSSPLLRSDENPGAIARSGAFPRGAIEYAVEVGMELFVLVNESHDGWLARCHVEPRPRDLGEVAGVETHPRHRGRGHAKGMLLTLATMLRRQFCGLIYLSLLQNCPSRALASSAGFSPVTTYRKHLFT